MLDIYNIYLFSFNFNNTDKMYIGSYITSNMKEEMKSDE